VADARIRDDMWGYRRIEALNKLIWKKKR
jgi:hypothetical protein